jgi:hypothetical protein
MHRTPPIRRGCTIAAALVVATCSAVPSAQADGPLVTSATDCPDRALEQPFRRWADPASYVLVDNGILEGGRDWTLHGEAAAEQGNELFYVHGPDETTSLALPPGSAARTAPVCVGIEHPTIRFFARNQGSLLSLLLVEVIFQDASGAVRSLPIAALPGGRGWTPTPPLPLLINLLPLLPGERTAVALRFKPLGSGGDWSIDDVYVDPWRHR